MFSSDHLEIIGPEGEVHFYDLDPAKGVTNIGRHPDNDIIIDSPNISPFHIVLDHRQKPYHVVYLGEGQKIRLNGQTLEANISTDLLYWSSLEVDDYTLILIEGPSAMMSAGRPATTTTTGPLTGPATSAPTTAGGIPTMPVAAATMPIATSVPPPAAPTVPLTPPPAAGGATQASGTFPLPAPAPAPVPLPGASGAAVPAAIPVRPPDRSDEFIIADMSADDREKTAEVDQTVLFTFTLVNGGPLVAAFAIDVQGLDRNWISVTPPRINLNENSRDVITLAITPPRHPSSRAGIHHFAIVITSPNYPDHVCQLGATLRINPFYEFSVRELDPKHQVVGYKKTQMGETALHLINKSNTPVDFRVEAVDDSRGCNFEFTVPGETSNLARQAELRLEPVEQIVPIHVNPLLRPAVAFRRRTYPYTVTVSMLQGSQTPRSVLGQIQVKPLIGPWILILIAMLIVALIVWFFQPWIYAFDVEQGDIKAGDPITVSWRASPFSELSLVASNGQGMEKITSASGTLTFAPNMPADGNPDVTYYLRAENFLSKFLTFLSKEKTDYVVINPVPPEIRVFTVDRDHILTGESITLRWETKNADTVTLFTNGVPEILLSEEHTGSRLLTPSQKPTIYQLEAKNEFDNAMEAIEITVVDPTPTPIPRPVIRRFTVAPLTVTEGQTVTVEWEVENATEIQISNLDGANFPPDRGMALHTPATTLNYVLTAINKAPDGKTAQAISAPIIVIVNPKPTPTPVPQKPIIISFVASPTTVVKGNNTTVELVWSITGTTTKIEISNPAVGVLMTNLPKSGKILVTVNDKTIFNLLAQNVDQIENRGLEVPATEPTPTPLPPPILDYFVLKPQDAANTNDVVFKGTSGDVSTYEVRWKAKVRFEWRVLNVAKIKFGGKSMEAAEFGAQDSYQTVITGPTYYQLEASNGGNPLFRKIEIHIQPMPAPNPPINVDGIYSGTETLIIWQTDAVGDVRETIVGYIVYRTRPDGTQEQASLDGTLGPNTFQWLDTASGCGTSYQVRAVYLDVSKDPPETRQTNLSETLYQTLPCPTPTP